MLKDTWRGDNKQYILPAGWLAAIMCITAGGVGLGVIGDCEGSNGGLEEAREKLMPRLSAIRERIRKEYELPSYVQDRKVTISVSPEGTICVSFTLPHRAPVITTLVTLFGKLSATEYEIDTSNGDDALGLKFKDRSGSVLVKSPEDGKRGEFMFFKDGKLTDEEIEAIVSAYEDNVRSR